MDRADHLGQPVKIVTAAAADAEVWLELRLALWPGDGREEFAADIARLLASPGTVNLLAYADSGEAMGFAEAGLRHDYVEGCTTSPVAFLEGVYVAPAYRRRGVAAALIRAVEDWGRAQGCSEFASAAAVDNVGSQSLHQALGFEATRRVVYFRRSLSGED